MFVHDFRETEHTPIARIMSLYNGMVKFAASVRRWGLIEGKEAEKEVASVAKVIMAPTEIMPCGW